MKIGTQLALGFLGIVMIFFMTTLVILYKSHQALLETAFSQLESIREDKKARLQDFFSQRESDIQNLAGIIANFKQSVFKQIAAIQTSKKFQLEAFFQERLHDLDLISQNQLVSQALKNFHEHIHPSESENQSQTLDALEAKFSAELKALIEHDSYKDLFLIAQDGDIVYTSEEYELMGKNIMSEEWQKTPLNIAFKKGLAGKTIQDFMPDRFSQTELAYFSTPIFAANTRIGVLILRITPTIIHEIVQQREGLGKTGDSYLIGELNGELRYRSHRFFRGQVQAMMGKKVETQQAENVLRQKVLTTSSNTKIYQKDDGEIVLTNYTLLNLPELRWYLVTTMTLEEALVFKAGEKQEDFFTTFVSRCNCHDLFLIHPEGKIFYTVKQEADYHTNILQGKYAQSKLAEVVRAVIKTQSFRMSDYALYAPSDNEPAAFLAYPIREHDEIQLIIALQLNDRAINHIMQQRAGMGNTGEAYLVGSDLLMRSNSFNDPLHHSIKTSFLDPSQGKVDTINAHAALAGKTGIEIINDYRNKPVLSAYTPFQLGNNTWALLVEIDKAEAFATLTQLQWIFAIITLIALLTIIMIALWLTYKIKTPLTQLVKVSNAIAAGQLDNQITTTRKDEFGQLLQAFADMQQQLKENLEQEINQIVQAISHGHFEERLRLDNKKGFFKALCESINRIIEYNQNVIEETMRIFAALAKGDLTQMIEKDYAGAFEQLKDDANTTVLKLQEIMTTIKQTANTVSHAAEEISQGNMSLSQRTEEQAASLQQTAASMEQMTSTVQQNTDNTKQAKNLAINARDRALQGKEVVTSAITAMNAISSSSQKITDIISVINDLAFQTNLLALNAAVEAARAGEQGRGFAVVASEVRHLAQRSAEASKEIKELIQDSANKVEQGTQLANQSGEVLAEIVTAVKKVSDIIAEIAAAGQEQSSGIHQVNKAVSQMDQMTQQNATLVEQAAAASSAMKDQAQNLYEQVSFFNVGEMPKISAQTTRTNKHNTTSHIHISQRSYSSPEQDEDWKEF
jgi:methyl-accepting chemotaxis protein